MTTEAIRPNLKLGLIQMVCSPQVDRNLEDAVQAVTEAAGSGAQVICLPELFRSLYFCQEEDPEHFGLAESIPNPTLDRLAQLAADLEIVLVVPIFEKRAQGIYHNSAIVLDADGSTAGHYRKMHIPDDPGFYEKFYFTPGDLGFRTFETRYAKIGILICWDQWFPEAARLTALSGADILFYPTAIGFSEADKGVAPKQAAAWETVQRGHAIANGVFLAAVNRVGKEKAIQFWGNSFLSSPFGEILAKGSTDKAEVLIADCDLNLIEETRQGWPFLRDRRVDAYSNLTQLYLDSNGF